MPKISALTSLAQASVDTAADVLPIVDATAPATTKKVTVQAMVNAGLAAAAPQGGTLALTGSLTVGGLASVTANSASAALTITQTGAGNAFVVEDSASTDSTPFVIDANGIVLQGKTTKQQLNHFTDGAPYQMFTAGALGPQYGAFSADAFGPNFFLAKSRSATIGANTVVQSGDLLGTFQFFGADGTGFIRAAQIDAVVDGTPGTNDMPGRLVFSTTADGASSPTERMRITSVGSVGIGGTPAAGRTLEISKNVTGATIGINLRVAGIAQSDVTDNYRGVSTSLNTADAATGPAAVYHFYASQGTISGGTRPAVTTQYGVYVESSLTGATTNYGVFSNIASGAGRWNIYAAGTAANLFQGVTGIGVLPAATSNLTVAASTTAVSSLNIPHGAAPTSPVNGDMWTTTAGLFIRINGATVGPLS